MAPNKKWNFLIPLKFFYTSLYSLLSCHVEINLNIGVVVLGSTLINGIDVCEPEKLQMGLIRILKVFHAALSDNISHDKASFESSIGDQIPESRNFLQIQFSRWQKS